MTKKLLSLAVLSAFSLTYTAVANAAFIYNVEDTATSGVTSSGTAFGGAQITESGKFDKNVTINVTSDADDIMGGYYIGSQEGEIQADVGNSKVTVNAESKRIGGDIYGGSYLQGESHRPNSYTLTAQNTSVEINSGSIDGMVVGGHRILGYNATLTANAASSSVLVKGGQVNKAVIGGSSVRILGDGADGFSETDSTSVTVSGGEVAGVVGGSISQSMENNQVITSSVGSTEINIDGGTVNNIQITGSELGDISVIGGGLVTFRKGNSAPTVPLLLERLTSIFQVGYFRAILSPVLLLRETTLMEQTLPLLANLI